MKSNKAHFGKQHSCHKKAAQKKLETAKADVDRAKHGVGPQQAYCKTKNPADDGRACPANLQQSCLSDFEFSKSLTTDIQSQEAPTSCHVPSASH